jgi:hypothetical protein
MLEKGSGDEMQLSHDVQLLILGAIIGGVFSLLAAFAGAHHEDWVESRRDKNERQEELELFNEIKAQLKAEVIQDVLAAIGSAQDEPLEL